MGQDQSAAGGGMGSDGAFEKRPTFNPEGAYQFKLEQTVDVPEQKTVDWDKPKPSAFNMRRIEPRHVPNAALYFKPS